MTLKRQFVEHLLTFSMVVALAAVTIFFSVAMVLLMDFREEVLKPPLLTFCVDRQCSVIEDRETTCQYVVKSNNTTPRLNNKGEHVCRNKE